MKNLIIFCFVFTSLNSLSEVLRSSIHSIEKIDNHYLIKFENGRVGFLTRKEKSFYPYLEGTHVEARLDNELNLLSMNSIKENKNNLPVEKVMENTDPTEFTPTLVPNLNETIKIFKRLNPNYKRASECSNRAHIWASEEFKTSGLRSMKVFVLFTASYINRVRFKWWFHVAPMVTVNENGTIQKRVLDFMFTHKPVTVREWTNQFIFSGRPCLPTKLFSEYDVNPQTEDCYLMEESMHYWTPVDLQKQELEGRYKTDFSQSELKSAYSEAF